MHITINGRKKEINAGTTVKVLLMQYRPDCAGVVIELNEKILKQTEWASTLLQENDVVEIIAFMGGG